MQSEATSAQFADLAQRATDAIANMTTTESFQAWLTTARKFHNYSFMNQLLIVSQFPTATHVAGFWTWKTDFNRLVLKGSKGIGIFAPMVIKDKDDPEERVLRFRVAHVFDISQTQGDPLPEPPDPILMEDANFDLTPYEHQLTDWLAGQGSAVTIEAIQGAANGYYHPATKRIVLSDSLSPAQRYKTLLHEAAHFIALHRKETAQEAEVVAETAAYLAAAYIGFDTSQYSLPYISGYAKDLDVFKIHLNTAHTIAQQLTAIYEEKKQA